MKQRSEWISALHRFIDFNPGLFPASAFPAWESRVLANTCCRFGVLPWTFSRLFDLGRRHPELLRVSRWCCTTAVHINVGPASIPLPFTPAAATSPSSLVMVLMPCITVIHAESFSSLMDCRLPRGRQRSTLASYSRKGETVTCRMVKVSHCPIWW